MNLTKIEQAWLSFRSGNMTETIGLCKEIIERNPSATNAFHLLAKSYGKLKDYDQAQIYYLKCIELYPDRSVFQEELTELLSNHIDHFSRGNTLAKEGKYDQAISHFQLALKQQHNIWDTYFNLALAYHRNNDFDRAIETYQQAIKLAPGRIDAYLNLGVLYKEKGDFNRAIETYLQGIEICPSSALYSNLANVYLLTDRLSEGIESCDKASRIDPNFANAYDIKGACLEQQQQTIEAIKYYRLAIEKNPNLANAHFNLAHSLLSLGEFREGWQEYQWRFKRGVLHYPNFSQPLWDGSFLEGKRILLWAEQGFGDTLQFVRYVWYVRERGGKVILRCPKPLVRLLSLVEGIEQVIAEDEPIPSFDIHAPLLDLPSIFQTNLENIPAVIPYLRAPEKNNLPDVLQSTGKLKVGIVWQSGDHTDRLSQKLKRHKSVSLSCFLSLQNDRLLLFSLQLGLDQLRLDENIVNLSPFISDFADTASILQHLDLVITIDTAVAHLGGGLGKPVWVLLPFASDWRWLKEREDSPWYPTMRLFRQTEPGEWLDVFHRVKSALAEFSPSSLPDPLTVFQEGNYLFQKRKLETAIKYYQQSIYLGKTDIYPYFNIGVVKRSQSLPEQGIVYFLLVIQKQPNYAPAYLTLAKSYIDREMLDDALSVIQTCLKLTTDLAEAYHTLGLIYFRLGKNQEAIEYYQKAIEKSPQDALTHYNLAISLLLEGNYKAGWREYEWRMSAQDALIKLKQPRWDGSNLKDKTILLWSEGGFGDTIQFLRYLPFLQQQGASILFACQKQLVNLIKQEYKTITVIPYNPMGEDPIGFKIGDQTYDYHLPLMSLPFILDLDYIPSPIPYISHYPNKITIPPKKIGIVWASGYRSTPNLYRLYKQKTCPILHFMELLSIPHIELYSFQVGKNAKDILPFLGDRVIDLSGRLQDFTDTVKLLREMDLLITVDTGIAHLAGAMGMPVWLLLPFSADWRWLIDRSDSPWYPTMKLFRQQQINDWQSVISQVKNELQTYYQSLIDRAQELLNEGNIAFEKGEMLEAITLFQEAIKLNPNVGRGYYNLGVVYKQLKMTDEAVWAYQEALKLKVDPALIYFALGNLYSSIGDIDRAKENYELSIQINPNLEENYICLIEIERRLKQLDLSMAYCQKLVELNHHSAKFYNNWALLLIDLKDYKLAQQKAFKSIELEPGYALAYSTLGHIYKMLGDIPNALNYYEKSITINPYHAGTLAIYANLLVDIKDYDRAAEFYQKAILIDPDFPLAHYGKSNMLLLKGDLLSGWQEYEWRWQFSKIKLPEFPFPKWQGEDLTNRALLIYGEQGFGDKLQFIRFVSVLHNLGAKVYYICPSPLNRLFKTIPNLIILNDSINLEELPQIDFFIPLMSIPKILEITIDRIPTQIPYFYPSPQYREYLSKWQGLKVGFAWASGKHINDLESLSRIHKSCKLDDFLGLLSIEELYLFSLQVDDAAEELDLYKHETRLIDCRPLINDFYDTASIILDLDLIITIDTALAHLAGALGKTVWVLLPFSADWRWLIDRSDSPWYPTMKLFRQQQINDWHSLFCQVKDRLAKYYQSPGLAD